MLLLIVTAFRSTVCRCGFPILHACKKTVLKPDIIEKIKQASGVYSLWNRSCFAKSFHFCLRFKGFVNKMSHLFYQFSSVVQLCPTVCDPMDCSTPGLPVHHQLPELTQTHVHRVGGAIQPSLPLSSPSPPAFSLSQHQGFYQ